MHVRVAVVAVEWTKVPPRTVGSGAVQPAGGAVHMTCACDHTPLLHESAEDPNGLTGCPFTCTSVAGGVQPRVAALPPPWTVHTPPAIGGGGVRHRTAAGGGGGVKPLDVHVVAANGLTAQIPFVQATVGEPDTAYDGLQARVAVAPTTDQVP